LISSSQTYCWSLCNLNMPFLARGFGQLPDIGFGSNLVNSHCMKLPGASWNLPDANHISAVMTHRYSFTRPG
jgi:hypothetical protein